MRNSNYLWSGISYGYRGNIARVVTSVFRNWLSETSGRLHVWPRTHAHLVRRRNRKVFAGSVVGQLIETHWPFETRTRLESTSASGRLNCSSERRRTANRVSIARRPRRIRADRQRTRNRERKAACHLDGGPQLGSHVPRSRSLYHVGKTMAVSAPSGEANRFGASGTRHSRLWNRRTAEEDEP